MIIVIEKDVKKTQWSMILSRNMSKTASFLNISVILLLIFRLILYF